MTAKIILELDDKLKEAAEKVAAMRGQSIDQMVKSYLESVVGYPEGESPLDKIRKILDGKITNPNLDWKEEKEKALNEKYGF